MSVEVSRVRPTPAHLRVDSPGTPDRMRYLERSAVLFLICVAAVLIGSVNRDLNSDEARLGLSAMERLGPFGQQFGGWEPATLPGRVIPSLVLFRALGEAWAGWSGLVLWPGLLAIAALITRVARDCRKYFGAGSGLLAILGLGGSALWMELPGGMLAQAFTGLFCVASLSSILRTGSGWKSGILAALAVFCGGWPALALIVLPVLILGRRGAYLSIPLLLPPVAAFAAWSAWALKTAPAVVWGQALAQPLRQSSGWGELPWIALMLLPTLLLAFAALSGAIRSNWSPVARSWALAWAQVGVISGLLGALVPGFAPIAWFPLSVAAAVLASGVLRAFLTFGRVGPRMTRVIFGVAIVANLLWVALALPRLVYVTAAMGYYRELAITSGVLSAFALAFALVGAWEQRRRWCLAGLVALALAIKVAHAGIYVPERDYRVGQGPWAHAIGQWVPPRWPIYTFHTWPADFAFDLCRPVRQLVSAQWLNQVSTRAPHHVLLLKSEFEHWPEDALKLEKIREFEDERGEVRVLARAVRERPSWNKETDATPAGTEE